MTNFDKFNSAMSAILKADPKVVKAAMEADKEKRAEQRKERKPVNDDLPKKND